MTQHPLYVCKARKIKAGMIRPVEFMAVYAKHAKRESTSN